MSGFSLLVALIPPVGGKIPVFLPPESAESQREAMERTLAKDEERIEVLEKTQKEQAELKAKVKKGRKHLADEIRLAVDARQWVESIQEYRDITELEASTLNRLIKEIVVHETTDSDKTRHISVKIHFNLKPIPEVEQVTN